MLPFHQTFFTAIFILLQPTEVLARQPLRIYEPECPGDYAVEEFCKILDSGEAFLTPSHTSMEHRRHILPSNHQLSQDDPNGLSRPALLDSTGNAQLHGQAPASIYHERKGHQPRVERSMYSMPTLPSQPARHPVAITLEVRHQSTRRRRHVKYSRNPIVDSPQYQAYRARQSREGNSDDAKWPLDLEMAFLDGNCRLS